MAHTKRLCLNMIVKNEMANLPRCLGSVADHIDCWVIGDTGSTDGTQAFVKSFFEARQIPGELHEFPFRNFEQARNQALECAYASALPFDYILFDDADMELVVENDGFRDELSGPGYRLLQRAGTGLAYWNTRLIKRDPAIRYRGVTHEYVDVPGGVEELRGLWYRDHATGSNRVDKFERDIKLLLEALEDEPENSRYWFYLAQSYRDAGRTTEAAVAYAKRAAMGGWAEEAWNARLQEARCLRTLGDEAGFVRQALAAYDQRPQRAEPLYDVARFYREKGMNNASVLFSELGMEIEKPEQDILFIEDHVYTTGLKEEFSVAANYAPDPVRKDRGFAVCNALALDRGIDDGPRNLASSNLYYYANAAAAMMPSFEAHPLAFDAPEGHRLLSPSIARLGAGLVVVQGAAAQQPPGNDRHDGARYYLLTLDDEFGVVSTTAIQADLPQMWVIDALQPFGWNGHLWGLASTGERLPDDACERVLVRIEDDGTCRLTDHQILTASTGVVEKHWMPLVSASTDAPETLAFISSCDPVRVRNERGQLVSEALPAISAQSFTGATQLAPYRTGWLALVQEAHWRAADKRHDHLYRFVWFDADHTLRQVSRPFYFQTKGIEAVGGLAWHPDEKRLLISYSVADEGSWLGVVDADEISAILESVDALSVPSPAARPEAAARSAIGIDHSRQRTSRRKDPGRPKAGSRKRAATPQARSTEQIFDALAPFLRDVDTPRARRQQSRAFDERIVDFLEDDASLPQINCFYEVMSTKADHRTLIAATSSMRTAGHPVRVWSYSPERLQFLTAYGVELGDAAEIMPRSLFEGIVAGSEIRYFSDIFRYAVLYERGGLWMDTDVVLLRPFPYRGDYFFNLQWRGAHQGHFICGNVMYARPYSPHLRALYELSVKHFYQPHGKEFGDIGPKLLSDYIASGDGAELQDWVFGPMFFNAIDWTELDRFDMPLAALGDFLNDDRVFGLHLWTARNEARADDPGNPLISMLIAPDDSFPKLASLAERFNTDKNTHTGNRHAYARVYDRLLAERRLAVRKLLEIGVGYGLPQAGDDPPPSSALWQSYFPFCHVFGVDVMDLSHLDTERFTSLMGNQSSLSDLRRIATQIGENTLDVIIDDGSHASFDEQLTLRELFGLLAPGGWYFIEDLDWQPPGEDLAKITLTKTLLREIKDTGQAQSRDPLGITAIAGEFAEILFFDSHYELGRAQLMGGLVAIRKRTADRTRT